MVIEERGPIDADYRVLDQYAAGIVDEAPRIEAIATISAGYKNDKGFPARPSDGSIFLHDPNHRAPELDRILAAADNKKLTVAFPFNNPAQFIQQRFAAYSASALLAYGDERQITVLEGGRHTVDHGTKEYELWAKKCKVQASIFFCLSEWVDKETPLVSMPDGLGYYRLRTTSRNSLRSILSTLRYAATFTRGYIAGLPFTLSIEQRDVAMADGKRQRVPVWVAVMQPPGGVHLTSRTFALIARQALDEGASLFLPAPEAETVETAIIEAGTALVLDDDEILISDEEADLLSRGGLCDAAAYRGQWFQIAKGHPLGEKVSPARAEFIAQHCAKEGLPLTSSLSAFLKTATDAMALDLISALELHLVNTETGELPISDEEKEAASSLAAELFEDEPEDVERDIEHEAAAEKRAEARKAAKAKPAEAFDPAIVQPWFQNAVKADGAAGAITVSWDVARGIGDLLSSVTQSMGAGIDITRYLTGNPSQTYNGLTFAEAKYLKAWANKPKAREQLLAVHGLATVWLAEQKAAKVEPAVLG